MSFALKQKAVEQAQEEAAELSEAADEAAASGSEVNAPDSGFEVVESRAEDVTMEDSCCSSADGDPETVIGEIQRPNGAVYSGQVVRGFASGKGRQKWPSGAMYEGDWMDDTMNGLGTLTTPDGATYVGRWRESRQHGEGKYTAPDRGRYEGQWGTGKMHGKGLYYWPDGAVFEGHFAEGEKCGEGVLRYANGSQYEGSWLDSKQHGMGVFTTKDGRSRRGEWKDGTRLRWLDDVVPENPKRVPNAPPCNFEIEQPTLMRESLLGDATSRCTERFRTIDWTRANNCVRATGLDRCVLM